MTQILKVRKVLSSLNAKSVFTQMAAYERLFGWAIIILGYVDQVKDLTEEVKQPQEIRDLASITGLIGTITGLFIGAKL